MKGRNWITISVFGIYCLLPAPSQAQQTFKWTEYTSADDQANSKITIALANGDTLVTNRFSSFIVPSTEGLPTAAEYCVSTAIRRNGKALFNSGACTRTDTDGDHFNYVWSNPDGSSGGTFQSVSGTGKYSGLKCEGAWKGTEQAKGLKGRWITTAEMTCLAK